MISTAHRTPTQLDLDVALAVSFLSQETTARQIAGWLYTTPDLLRARLALGGHPAIVAATQILLAIREQMIEHKRQEATMPASGHDRV